MNSSSVLLPLSLLFVGCGEIDRGGGASDRAAPTWNLGPEPVLVLGRDETGPPAALFGRISDAALLPGDRIAVLEGPSNEIRAYDGSGRHIWTAAGRGEGPSEITLATFLTRDRQGLLVAPDRRTSAMKYYTDTGAFVRHERVGDGSLLPGTYYPPISGGAVPVRDSDPLQPADPRGFWTSGIDFRIRMLGADSSHASPDLVGGTMYYMQEGDAVHFGTVPFSGGEHHDAGVDFAIAGDGRGPVHVIDAVGTSEFRSPHRARPVVDALVEEYAATLDRREIFERALSRMELPDSTPEYDELRVDALGRIWIRRFTLTGPARWAVVDRTGRELGAVKLPEDALVLDADEDRLVVRRHTDLDVAYLEIWTLAPVAS